MIGGDQYDRKLIAYPDELFDAMVEELHNPTPVITPNDFNPPTRTKDKKPLDPDYFSKYYKKNLCSPVRCPDCGKTISSKSNLSKHRKRAICEKHRSYSGL